MASVIDRSIAEINHHTLKPGPRAHVPREGMTACVCGAARQRCVTDRARHFSSAWQGASIELLGSTSRIFTVAAPESRTESLKRMRVSRSGLSGVDISALDTP